MQLLNCHHCGYEVVDNTEELIIRGELAYCPKCDKPFEIIKEKTEVISLKWSIILWVFSLFGWWNWLDWYTSKCTYTVGDSPPYLNQACWYDAPLCT